MTKKPRELERIIKRDGWRKVEQTGSHQQYEHPTKPGKVTIPFHKGKDISPETERQIYKQAGLKKGA